mmetsp:Transcript_97775/g.224188  ORF Transcript_97775/g.224188 Transcript_97775/m.224188 type:complete len:324 (-) Transcript_97775:746-1717(-)
MLGKVCSSSCATKPKLIFLDSAPCLSRKETGRNSRRIHDTVVSPSLGGAFGLVVMARVFHKGSIAVFKRRSEVVTELSVLHTPCREPPASDTDTRGAPSTTNSTLPSDDVISLRPALSSTNFPPITTSPPTDNEPAVSVRDRKTPATAKDVAAVKVLTVAFSSLVAPKTASVLATTGPSTVASPPSAARDDTDNVSSDVSVACKRRLVFNEVRIVAATVSALPRRTNPRTESDDPKCKKSKTDKQPAPRTTPDSDIELPMRQKCLTASEDPSLTVSRVLRTDENLPQPLTLTALPTRQKLRTERDDPKCKKSKTDRVAGLCAS